MTGIEELKKKFIADDDVEYMNVEDMVGQILEYCIIDKKGFVKLNQDISKKMNLKDKIFLVLAARHLGNKLQEKSGDDVTINNESTAEEIQKYLGEKKKVVSARLKDLKDERRISSTKRGYFKVAPFYIVKFLENIRGGKNDK